MINSLQFVRERPDQNLNACNERSVPIFLLLTCLTFLFGHESSNAQEKPSATQALLKQLKSERFEDRQVAVKNLIELGESAVSPLFQSIKSNSDDLETVAKCGEILIEIIPTIEFDSKVYELLKAESKQFLESGDPKLVGLATKIRSKLKFLTVPSRDEAFSALRRSGCKVTSSPRDLISIELKHEFTGSDETLSFARAFNKHGIRMGIDIKHDLKLFKVLPFLNVKVLGISSRGELYDTKRLADKLREVAKCKSINQLAITVTGFPRKELAFVKMLPNISSIQLPKTTTDEELKHLAGFKRLKRLEFFNCREIVGHGFSHLSKVKSLRSLNLSSCITKDKSLKSLGRLTQLSGLTLPQHSTNDTLKSIKGLKNLEYLRIGNSSITDSGMKHLVGLEKLDYLVLEEIPITHRSIPFINAIPNLKRVLIYSTLITAKESEEIKPSKMNSKFEFSPKDDDEKQIIFGLVESGVGVRLNSFEDGQYDIYLSSKTVDPDFSMFKQIAQLKIRAFSSDFPMTVAQANDLCKLDAKTNIFLGGTSMSDKTAEIFHANFKYVVDHRNGKKRTTNKWKR